MIDTKFIFFKRFIFTGLILYVSSAIPFLAHSKTIGVKTSYKRYSILKYKNQDILCEPYIVKKDDQLYKIFKNKGEITHKNFSLFLTIFKKINPRISNIDKIKTGINILIPLQKVEDKDYDKPTPGIFDVPVIEFSNLPKGMDLTPFIKKHKIKKGETVSKLMDKAFFKKGGGISKQGIKAFYLANPAIKNIHIIYEGADIFLPDPSIKSQPWFKLLALSETTQNKTQTKKQDKKQLKIKAYELLQLKKYSSLIGGTLLNRGKIYFPKKNKSSGVLDLSLTPVIENKNGPKILILPGDTLNEALLKNIQTHWKNLKVQLISDVIDRLRTADKNKLQQKSNKLTEYKKIIGILLLQTRYDYITDAKIPFMLNDIPLEASFGRITRKNTKDVLINYGTVYGTALQVLEKQGFDILFISPKLSVLELIEQLFSHLGYATWANPSFPDKKIIESIKGVYAAKGQDKLFIPIKPLTINASAYLKKEKIKILSMEDKTHAR
ncbi:hypothetical protein [Desulfobacula sp.]